MHDGHEARRAVRAWQILQQQRELREAAVLAEQGAKLRPRAMLAGLGVLIGAVVAIIMPFHHIRGGEFLVIVGLCAAIWLGAVIRDLMRLNWRACGLPRSLGGFDRDAVLRYPKVLERARAAVAAAQRS